MSVVPSPTNGPALSWWQVLLVRPVRTALQTVLGAVGASQMPGLQILSDGKTILTLAAGSFIVSFLQNPVELLAALDTKTTGVSITPPVLPLGSTGTHYPIQTTSITPIPNHDANDLRD